MTGIPALLALGALAALANLAGGLLLASSGAYRREAKLLKYLIALGAGFMLAAIFKESRRRRARDRRRHFRGRCRSGVVKESFRNFSRLRLAVFRGRNALRRRQRSDPGSESQRSKEPDGLDCRIWRCGALLFT